VIDRGNMGKIVLSIKPEYTQRILSGDKKYEYRKILAKKDVKKIIIYLRVPIMYDTIYQDY